jgi:hypothetical protein
MNWYHREPTLEEILSDSITRAVMEADGVDQKELEAMLSRVGRTALPLPTRARMGTMVCRSHHAAG